MINLLTTRFLLVLIFTVCAAMLASAAVVPIGQTEFDFLYDRVERQQVRGYDYFDFQLGPYWVNTISTSLRPFEILGDIHRDEVVVMAFASEDFRAARRTRPSGFESLRTTLAGQPLAGFHVYTSVLLDEALARDENYTGKKWRGLAGDVEQAFATYHNRSFDLIAGRFASFWGPRNSLILASDQKLDGFGYTLRWGRLRASYRLARLDGLDPDDGLVTQYENRYFAAHRLDFHLASNLRLGVFETVVFGGPGRQIDLFYLNPLIFFHGTQLNESTDDNTMIGFDFDCRPIDGCRLYGQLVVDDIQVDNSLQSDQEPDQIGLLVGSYFVNLVRNLDVKVEYSRVDNWVFNQGKIRNRYLNHGKLIGAALGNDYDLIDLSLVGWFQPDLAASLNFSYHRQGEGRVDAVWTEPWLDIEGEYSDPFPTGIVEKTATVSAGLKGFPVKFIFVDLEAGVDWVKNRNHVSDDNQTTPFARLMVSTFLTGPVDID